MKRLPLISLLFSIVFAAASEAAVYELPADGSAVVGTDSHMKTVYKDTLLDIARRNSLGYYEIIRANPGVDMWLPGEGTDIMLPGRRILPPGPREGIVVNLPEHRLYYYPKPKKHEKPVVITYPVSIGKMDWTTPIGETRVIQKEKHPFWFPPEGVRKEHLANGDPLPPGPVKPGPDNPLGDFAMRLAAGNGTYLIHGTNNPMAVGMAITHGCIRMYPEDVAALFPQIPVGTKVWLVNAPVKVAFENGELLMEVHPQVDDEGQNTATEPDLELLSSKLDEALGTTTAAIHWDFAKQALQAANGIPTVVGIQADMDPTAAEAAIQADDKDKAATESGPDSGSTGPVEPASSATGGAASVGGPASGTGNTPAQNGPGDKAQTQAASGSSSNASASADAATSGNSSASASTPAPSGDAPSAKSDSTASPNTQQSQPPEPPVTTLRPVKAPVTDSPPAAATAPLAEAGPQRP